MSVFLTTFSGANENPLSDGGIWNGGYTGVQNLQRLSSTAQVASTAVGNDGIMSYNLSIFSPNVRVKFKISALALGAGGFSQIGVIARATAPATNTFFFMVCRPGGTVLGRCVNGTVTDVVTDSTSWAAGDVGELILQQTLVAGLKNNNPLLAGRDTNIAGAGRVGVIATADGAGATASVNFFFASDETDKQTIVGVGSI